MVDVIKGSPTNWSWGVVNWGDVAGKPSTFPPSAHKSTHATGQADALTSADIGAAPANLFDSIYTKAFRSVNYASAANWAVGTGNAPDTGTGGDFVVNGDGNLREWGIAPFGHRGIIWVTRNNDPTSDADGGWSKTITGLDPNKAYLSVVYVKRATSSTNGTFYHGCSGSNTLNLDGTTNTNPYFHSFNIGTLPQNVWCISIGIIKANNDSDTVNIGLVGVYRLDTGAKIVSGTAYKMGTGTSQIHRTYLYYSTDPAAELHWYAPGFYKIDGTEPTLAELTGNLVIFCNGSSYASWHAGNSHKTTHATGGTDALTPADIGALAVSAYTAADVLSKIKTVDGAGCGLDADLLDGLQSTAFMRSSKIYGSATFTDSIAAATTLTKNIALGNTYSNGMAVVSFNTWNFKQAGLVFFGTNNLKTKATGFYSESTAACGSAACREFLGSVTLSGSDDIYVFGYLWTGHAYIKINELYISGTNLVIVFRNTHTTASNSLNCRIDWEVW